MVGVMSVTFCWVSTEQPPWRYDISIVLTALRAKSSHLNRSPTMSFPSPLLHGTLRQRRVRFLADITLDTGEEITAHVPNSGAMLGAKSPGMGVWVSTSDNPARKLKYTLELVDVAGVLVGVNTAHPNPLVAHAIASGHIAELTGYAVCKREVKYGTNSRIDMLLTDPARPACYVEVKNVHMSRTPGLAEFPDGVTARGAKHMAELAEMVKSGHRAVVVFVIQRMDVNRFRVASDLDPQYLESLKAAVNTGVEVLCYRCHVTTDTLKLDRTIPWVQD